MSTDPTAAEQSAADSSDDDSLPTEEELKTLIERFAPEHRFDVEEILTEDPELYGYFTTVIPQPFYGSAGDLPETVELKCCAWKSCGNTELELHRRPAMEPVNSVLYRNVEHYVYTRFSNGDVYLQGDLERILEGLNSPRNFPVDEDAYERYMESWSN